MLDGVVTRDYRDFSHLAQVLLRTRRPFPGILFVSPALPPGDVGAVARAVEGWAASYLGVPAGTVDWLVPG